MNITESKLYKAYPRVAPSAEAYGFTYDDIKSLDNKIKNSYESSSIYFNKGIVRQVVLKSIIVRLGLSRNEFFEHIEIRRYSNEPDEILRQDCGLFNIKAYKAIIK